MAGKRDSENETQRRGGKRAPTSESAHETSTPLPSWLRFHLEEQARAKGIGTSEITSAWWTRLDELCRKDALSDETVLEAFAVCLSNQPDTLRFFPENLSKWRAIAKRQAEETMSFPDQGESKGIDLEAIIAGKYHCPQCGRDAAHAIVSGYYDCDCGFDYGMKARDFFEHEAEKSAPDSLPAE